MFSLSSFRVFLIATFIITFFATYMIRMAADPKREDFRFETETNASSTTCPMNTPPTTAQGPDCLWSSRGAVPWPDNTFQIIEKNSGKALTLVGNQPKLLELGSTSTFNTHWLCVKHNGYFGFQHAKTGNYIGHDGESGMRASAPLLNEWELWTPREHPEGGYELLSPFWAHTLMILCVHGDGSTLVRRAHGTTLWEFVRV